MHSNPNYHFESEGSTMKRPEIQLFPNDILGYNIFVSNYFVTKSFLLFSPVELLMGMLAFPKKTFNYSFWSWHSWKMPYWLVFCKYHL